MLENIRLSFQGVWSHRLRSFLTMLGIIIGIAAIIAIVSTIKERMNRLKESDRFWYQYNNSTVNRKWKLSSRNGIWNSEGNSCS